MIKNYVGVAAIAALAVSCATHNANYTSLSAPNGKLSVSFGVNNKQQAWYLAKNGATVVIDTSVIGLVRKDTDLSKNLSIVSISNESKITDTYTMLQGKKKDITYTANQKTLHLQNKDGNKMDIVFNISNDGIAFKYAFPNASNDVKYITNEVTTYNFMSTAKAWLQPMSEAKTGWEHTNPSYEENYKMGIPVNTVSPLKQGWVYPALFNDGANWISVSETGVGDTYCGTHLIYSDSLKAIKIAFPQDKERFSPASALYPEAKLPWETPWRIITVGDLPTLSESTLGTDLAPKAVSTDDSYIHPGIASWSWAILKDESVNYDTTKQFIDYAHNMNWPYCLIDADWDRRIGMDKIKELAAYAKERNVKLILWYNSAGDWNTVQYTPKNKFITPESRDTEFKMLQDMGIAGVKIDFFGGDGQSMIAYYHAILKSALEHKILVNFHGATLPRGLQRTYPNLMTAEAIKGFEFITFFQDVADLEPSHAATIPFTRNLYDPMDFTPMALYRIPNINRRTTSAFELALPTLFLSGIQHLAEIPEGMAKMPDYVVTYLKDIPTAWDESKLLAGYPGKEVVMARRKGDTWFISAINGEDKAKDITVDLGFIKKEGYIITDGNKTLFEKTAIKPGKVTLHFKPFGGSVLKF